MTRQCPSLSVFSHSRGQLFTERQKKAPAKPKGSDNLGTARKMGHGKGHLADTRRHNPYAVQTRQRHRSWRNDRRRRRARQPIEHAEPINDMDCFIAQQELDPRGSACLSDMPPELIEAISAHVANPRDLASARCASRLFSQATFEEAAVAWGAECLPRLVAAGAPLRLVAAAITLRAQPIGFGLLACAAQGGRVDVVQLILDLIEVCGIFH
nr:hypothetical protein [Pandoravirus massiliensis]